MLNPDFTPRDPTEYQPLAKTRLAAIRRQNRIFTKNPPSCAHIEALLHYLSPLPDELSLNEKIGFTLLRNKENVSNTLSGICSSLLLISFVALYANILNRYFIDVSHREYQSLPYILGPFGSADISWKDPMIPHLLQIPSMPFYLFPQLYARGAHFFHILTLFGGICFLLEETITFREDLSGIEKDFASDFAFFLNFFIIVTTSINIAIIAKGSFDRIGRVFGNRMAPNLFMN
jgi:hypothetical protein